jgi:Rps23 Pro-64 3,4-dihydroxylase Tpa1-like proline 4-hydroxylase
MSFTHKIVSGFLTKEECDLLLNFSLDNLKLNVAETVDIYTESNREKPKNSLRKSDIAFYPFYNTFPFLYEKISKALGDEINVKGFDLNYKNSEFQFTKYGVGDYFNWHKDVIGDIITQKDRYCSMVIQLNNDYEGGNLEIKIPNDNEIIIVEKGVGNLIVFLSDMEHRVTNITSGNRYTLVNWIGLNEIKNFKKTLL